MEKCQNKRARGLNGQESGDHFPGYTNIELLHFTLETNIRLNVNYTSI